MSDATIRIGPAETIAVVRDVLAVGTHTFPVHTAGNSVLSSAYVKSGAGTAVVKWYDFHSSNGEEAAARFDLAEHPSLATGQKSRLLVARIHNNCRVEVIVSGAPAEVMVLASLVADFPVDIDGKLDGEAATLTEDDGLPIAVYDPDQGKFFLLRGSNGYIDVDVSGPGVGKVLEASDTLAATGPAVVVLSESVPVGKTWTVRYGEVLCRGYGRWDLFIDAVRVGGGVTGPAREQSRHTAPPTLNASAGQVVEVRYTYSNGPAGMPIDAFIGVSEI